MGKDIPAPKKAHLLAENFINPSMRGSRRNFFSSIKQTSSGFYYIEDCTSIDSYEWIVKAIISAIPEFQTPMKSAFMMTIY